MSEIRFSSKEHEKFFYQMLAKCGKHDSYYSSFFYCVGISVPHEVLLLFLSGGVRSHQLQQHR